MYEATLVSQTQGQLYFFIFIVIYCEHVKKLPILVLVEAVNVLFITTNFTLIINPFFTPCVYQGMKPKF